MNEEKQLEIYRQLTSATNQYNYFLLAATGACIAFSLNQTKDLSVTVYESALAISVMLWGLSVFLGFRHIQYGNASIHMNANMLSLFELKDGEGAKRAFTKMKELSDKSEMFSSWQFITFITGCIAYFVWHTINMFLRA